jgi:hypothetical protein
MFRTFAFAFAATVALGMAAVTVDATPAAAWGWRHHHHFWGGGFRFHTPAFVSYRGCYVKRVVPTPWGPRVRLFNVCGQRLSADAGITAPRPRNARPGCCLQKWRSATRSILLQPPSDVAADHATDDRRDPE